MPAATAAPSLLLPPRRFATYSLRWWLGSGAGILWALCPLVIQRRISHGVQSRQGAICRSRLLTVTTTMRQQGRDVWQFLEQAWIADHRSGEMPSLLPDP